MSYDEELFKFVLKTVPVRNFVPLKNGEQIIRSSEVSFPFMGNFDIDPLWTEYHYHPSRSPVYLERHYYSIGLKSDGYFKIVDVTERTDSRYDRNFSTAINDLSISIRNVDCEEFAIRFSLIRSNLLNLNCVPKPIPIPIQKPDYCAKAIDLMTNTR